MTPGSSLFWERLFGFGQAFICLNCKACGYLNGSNGEADTYCGGRQSYVTGFRE